jgi:hypothetical protein
VSKHRRRFRRDPRRGIRFMPMGGFTPTCLGQDTPLSLTASSPRLDLTLRSDRSVPPRASSPRPVPQRPLSRDAVGAWIAQRLRTGARVRMRAADVFCSRKLPAPAAPKGAFHLTRAAFDRRCGPSISGSVDPPTPATAMPFQPSRPIGSTAYERGRLRRLPEITEATSSSACSTLVGFCDCVSSVA